MGLHAAGYVHRDVRWSNVLCGHEGWFLCDLENVAKAGEDPSRPAPGFESVAWAEGTLDSTGCYTSKSDVHLVGLMLTDARVADLCQGILQLCRSACCGLTISGRRLPRHCGTSWRARGSSLQVTRSAALLSRAFGHLHSWFVSLEFGAMYSAQRCRQASRCRRGY